MGAVEIKTILYLKMPVSVGRCFALETGFFDGQFILEFIVIFWNTLDKRTKLSYN